MIKFKKVEDIFNSETPKFRDQELKILCNLVYLFDLIVENCETVYCFDKITGKFINVFDINKGYYTNVDMLVAYTMCGKTFNKFSISLDNM